MVTGLFKTGLYQLFLQLEILPLLALASYLDIHQITAARQISAAVVNVSGRQRMLSQRSALYCLQLVRVQSPTEREKLRSELWSIINLMEKSHNGLIHGDPSLHLSGEMSATVKAMYFNAPLCLDRQIRQYIAEIKAFLQCQDNDLTLDNSHLVVILEASSTELLAALDAVVTQYQRESEMEQLAIDLHLLELYENSIKAHQAAQEKAEKLEQALRELQKAQAQLLHAEKMSGLGQLVAGVAHEINNPVSFISGNLHYARDYVRDLLHLLDIYQQEYPHPVPRIEEQIQAIDLDFLIEDLPKVLSSMQVGAERICHLVASLRLFSRNDQGEMSLVDVHEGIESTLLILQHRLKGNGKCQAIETIKEYGILPQVECYSGQLNQVFMNILSNAIDALSEGVGADLNSSEDNIENCNQTVPTYKPQIRIQTKLIGSSISVEISDNGPGIPEKILNRIFDPFFTTKDVGKGTGLGLSISYQIVVEKHAGMLKCQVLPTGGTKFSIQIPLRQSSKVSTTLNQQIEYASM